MPPPNNAAFCRLSPGVAPSQCFQSYVAQALKAWLPSCWLVTGLLGVSQVYWWRGLEVALSDLY